MINKAIKKKWLAALRSNKFPQGRGQLKSDEGYCCLAVLACVVDPKRKTWDAGDGFFGGNERRGDVVKEQVELIGGCIPPKTIDKLTKMNDGHTPSHHAVDRRVYTKHTFAEIADFIERSKRI